MGCAQHFDLLDTPTAAQTCVRCSERHSPQFFAHPSSVSIFVHTHVRCPENRTKNENQTARWISRRRSQDPSLAVSTTQFSRREHLRRRRRRGLPLVIVAVMTVVVAMMLMCQVFIESRSPAEVQESRPFRSPVFRPADALSPCPWAGSTRSRWCIR